MGNSSNKSFCGCRKSKGELSISGQGYVEVFCVNCSYHSFYCEICEKFIKHKKNYVTHNFNHSFCGVCKCSIEGKEFRYHSSCHLIENEIFIQKVRSLNFSIKNYFGKPLCFNLNNGQSIDIEMQEQENINFFETPQTVLDDSHQDGEEIDDVGSDLCEDENEPSGTSMITEELRCTDCDLNDDRVSKLFEIIRTQNFFYDDHYFDYLNEEYTNFNPNHFLLLKDVKPFTVNGGFRVIDSYFEGSSNKVHFQDINNLILWEWKKRSGVSDLEFEELLVMLKNWSKVSFLRTTQFKYAEQKMEKLNTKDFSCEKGHKILVVPIEECIKIIFSTDLKKKLENFPRDKNDGYYNRFSQSEYFHQVFKTKGRKFTVFFLNTYSDDYKAFVFSYKKFKGIYYTIVNGLSSHVFLFCKVLDCEFCLDAALKELVQNTNSLCNSPFLLKVNDQKYDCLYLRAVFDNSIYTADTPELLTFRMNKQHNSLKPCADCMIDKENLDDLEYFESYKFERKTPELFREIHNFVQKYLHEDKTIIFGKKVLIEDLEKHFGISLITSYYDTDEKREIYYVKDLPPAFGFKKFPSSPQEPFHLVRTGEWNL